jgi:hypothetical protein
MEEREGVGRRRKREEEETEFSSCGCTSRSTVFIGGASFLMAVVFETAVYAAAGAQLL